VTEDSTAGRGPGTPGDDGGDERERRIGTVVDKYQITRLLGRGGMGAVYEARHAKLSRRVAIKFLLPDLARNREILHRFENEAKAAGLLEHPNLAAVTDSGRAADGAPYLVMEYLQGEDVSKLLRRSGPLSVSRAVDIVLQACWGLAVAHKARIVHRDLKPENLFVTEAGGGGDVVKVLDFGIAKLRSTDGSFVTSTGTAFGTAHYMSPEQARGAAEVDERTDIWSLGVVLYELLAGRKPFEGDQFLQVIHQILSVEPPTLATLRPGLPPALVAAVARAMRKDISARFENVVAFGEAIGPFAGSSRSWAAQPGARFETAATPMTNPPGAARRTTRSRNGLIGLVAGGAVLVAVALALALGRSHPVVPASVASKAPAQAIPDRRAASREATAPTVMVAPQDPKAAPNDTHFGASSVATARVIDRSSGHQADAPKGQDGVSQNRPAKAVRRSPASARATAPKVETPLGTPPGALNQPLREQPTKIDSDNPY
jgi:tRNA A-37 threonylcarbamoyl transferase component Bud32